MDEATISKDLATLAHEIRQRIASAPVEKWLKNEAMNDLDRLIAQAAADLNAVHERYNSDNAPVEGVTAEEAYEKSEATISQDAIDWQGQELRRTALSLAVQRVGTIPGYNVIAMAVGYEAYLREGTLPVGPEVIA